MKWQRGYCKNLVWIHLLFLFCSSFSSVSGKLLSEKTVLLGFKNFVSDPSGILSGWDANSSHHCSWSGVSCNSESRVLSINITGRDCERGNSLANSCSRISQLAPFYGFGIRKACSCSNNGKIGGKLSPLIGQLTELEVLSLPFNDLSGEIPVEIWGLENLQVLDLEGNSFSGKLPNRFQGLRKLKVLNFGHNKIHGEIPISLSKCVGLEVLNLAGNAFNGTIPGFLSPNRMTGNVSGEFGFNCQKLEHLDLSGNLFIGGIPHSLGKCGRLRTLLLFSNKFEGVIPRELGQLLKLEVLDVSRNSLSGHIPMELGNCGELSVLVLSNLFDPLSTRKDPSRASMFQPLGPTTDEYNNFQGSIPMEITSLPKLKVVWAPRAKLEGKLSSNWGKCDILEVVNLAENFFSGELTGVFRRCKNLHFLNLSSNRLTGELDEKLPVPCMTVFDVSENLMSGSIPSFSCHVCPHRYSFNADIVLLENPSFPYLKFFKHKSRIEFPFAFSGASLLVIHNFGENNFTGPIPWFPVVPLPARLRKQIDYALLAGGNKLTGPIPGDFCRKCRGLNGMIANFSNNKIHGEIPFDIGKRCRCLKVLDASGNLISGSISQSFGNLGPLFLLDLSRNKVQGQIPVSLGQLKYLKYLSLAGNNLSDIIPASLGQLHSLEVLDLSYNALSGEIPESLVNLRNLTVLLLNNNKLTGQIPSGLTNLITLLSTYNASFNNFSQPLLLKDDVVSCGTVLGNPFPHSCRKFSLSVRYANLQGTNGYSHAVSPSGNDSDSGEKGFSSIEIASIISASAIFSVLLALIVLYFYTKRWVPNSRVQVSEPREIKVFTDIGVPLTYESIVQATEYFNTGNCIGNGGFGATYKAEISPGTLVAVKRLSVGRFHGVQQFHAEIKTLERVRHPNLVTLIGYHASETEMFLIYNYLPGGNLEKFIQEKSAKAVDWRILHRIALDIANALAYLHDQCVPRVLHRDVKPSNILLDSNFNAHLSDFGLSRLLGNSETHATTGVAGTFGYVAPEYALTCRVSEKADVYSYGVLLLELMSDKKALDPSFSSHANGFNIVSWASLLLQHGQAKDVFNTRLWDSGPKDKLVDALHLAVMCTVETFSIRPTMKQVVRRLTELAPPSG